MIAAVVCCVKVRVPSRLNIKLDEYLLNVAHAVKRMLLDRSLNSTRHYSDLLPSVVSKGLINKYQKNKKCKKVSSLVIPICGDKGKIIKIVEGGVRIPILDRKGSIPVTFPHPIAGFIRSVEFFKRSGDWYANFCYNTLAESEFEPVGNVGVDFSSVGSVATLSDPTNGKVLHLGFNPAKTKEVWKGRKRQLQKEGKNRLLHKIKNKQSRRTFHENHLVSKQIVDYAVKHRRVVVIERLSGVLKGKIARYSKSAQWSFAQLKQFLLYKAALRGVMVIEANPEYTSKECSRCHQINNPNGKKYLCGKCGHNDHRDANAGFNLATRVSPIGGVARESECSSSGLLVAPFPGKELQKCH